MAGEEMTPERIPAVPFLAIGAAFDAWLTPPRYQEWVKALRARGIHQTAKWCENLDHYGLEAHSLPDEGADGTSRKSPFARVDLLSGA
jgi:hypothetical protein